MVNDKDNLSCYRSQFAIHNSSFMIIDKNQKYIIETKIFTGQAYFQRGKRQLADYLRSKGLAEGYYVVFSNKHSETDTRYFEGLCTSYGGDLLIISVLRLEAAPPLDHLSASDAEHIIGELKPKVAILTHFGMTMWRAKPWELAQSLSQKTGVKVLAARDGMKFDLSQLDDTE